MDAANPYVRVLHGPDADFIGVSMGHPEAGRVTVRLLGARTDELTDYREEDLEVSERRGYTTRPPKMAFSPLFTLHLARAKS